MSQPTTLLPESVQPSARPIELTIFGLAMLSLVVLLIAPHRVGLF
jgi:uncharacterized membrane-anchored protein